IAACILAAALLGSIAWKGAHKAEVPKSSPVETASPPLAPPVAAPLPTPAPGVGPEVREAKPGTDVLVDHRPQGKINRNGAFSIDLTAGDHQIQWTARNKLSGTVVRQFVVDRPVRLTAADLVPAKPVVPGTVPGADEAAWQTVKDSQTPLEIEQFIARY